MVRVARFVHVVVFSGPFSFQDGNSWYIDGFNPVGVIGGNFGVDYLIVGNDFLVVLYRSPDNVSL